MRFVAWSSAARWPTPGAPPHPDALRVESSGKDFGERPEATDRSAGIPSIPMDGATAGRNDTLTVQLELELGREPVTGCLRTEDGIEERFVGWLGFVDALKRLREAEPPSRPEREERR
jgi:hypothetical protein